MILLKTLALSVATAIAEIVGCYSPYLWLRRNGSVWLLLPGRGNSRGVHMAPYSARNRLGLPLLPLRSAPLDCETAERALAVVGLLIPERPASINRWKDTSGRAMSR